MKQLTCEMCGSTELIKQDGFFVCQTCGCKYSVEEAKKMMIEGTVDVKINKTNEIKNLLARVINLLDEDDEEAFEDACKCCKKILNMDANNINASVLKILAES